MQPRIDIITLGVADVAEARRFYVDGLGWEPALDVPDEIVFLQVGHGLLLGLFAADALAADALAADALAADALAADAGDPSNQSSGPPPMSLAHIVDTEEDVIALVEAARAAGAIVLKTPQRADFGGFHAYFADPSGFRWEVATNSGWSVDAEGKVTIGPVE